MKRLLTIVLAGLLAVCGAVAVLAYVHKANERAVAGLKAEVVYKASGPIPAGTSLADAQKENLLTTVTLPAEYLPADPVVSITSKNKNLVTSGAVGQGQLVLQSMLVTATQAAASGQSALAVPKGDQGVTIQVCPNEAVGGYIGPGSLVDIYGTYPGTAKSGLSVSESCDVSHQAQVQGAVTTSQEFAGLEVLCVGQYPECAPSTSSASSPSSLTADPAGTASSQGAVLVTLAVTTTTQAEDLITLAQVGLPYMTLPGP